jgi:YHS domain-containing protein
MSRFILLTILFSILYYLLNFLMKVIFSSRKRVNRQSEPEELVQDPYCQTYIPKRSAIRKRLSGKNYYFCKQECLEKFIQNRNP